MLQKLLDILPELSLFIGIMHLYWRYLWGEESTRLYAKTARIWLLISMFSAIVFYDRSLNPQYFANNAYTLLFSLFSYIFAYIVLNLAPQYFSAEKKTGCKFYILFLLAIITINILLSCVNLLSTAAGYVLLMFINYRLQEVQEDKKSSRSQARYLMTNVIILLLLIIGVVGLYILSTGKTEYQELKMMLEETAPTFALYMYISCLIIPFLYALGIVPFHSFNEDRFGKAILPSSHYFAVVAPWGYWGAFLKLNTSIVAMYASDIIPVYVAFALLSVVFGAIGANTSVNLHRIYSFIEMYYFGAMLLLLSLFSPAADFAAFTCLLVYMFGINGVYLVFYSLKSRNEYLSATISLSGLAETRPYATATLLISLFSLLGMPPLAGFLGQTALASILIASKQWVSLGVVFISLLLLAKCYLEIIKTAYFEHKMVSFDVENKNLWFYMLVNIICTAIIAFNPLNVMESMKDMFYVIFI